MKTALAIAYRENPQRDVLCLEEVTIITIPERGAKVRLPFVLPSIVSSEPYAPINYCEVDDPDDQYLVCHQCAHGHHLHLCFRP